MRYLNKLKEIDFSLHGNFIRKSARRVAFASTILFLVLAAVVHIFPVSKTDVAISQEIQEGSPALAPFMAFISFFGIPWVASLCIISASLIFFFLSYRREAFFTLTAFLADAANSAAKLVIARPRPTQSFVNVLQKLNDPSFPSGHVVHYVVFFGFVYVVMLSLWKPPGWLWTLITILFCGLVFGISLSRMYLGVHWATDVLGGYMAGFTMLWVILHLYFRGRPDLRPEPVE